MSEPDQVYMMTRDELANELRKLIDENIKLRVGLNEALEWNWLDDDAPGDIHGELYYLANPDITK